MIDLTKLPTTEQSNANFMAQNPQYSYNQPNPTTVPPTPKAPIIPPQPQNTLTNPIATQTPPATTPPQTPQVSSNNQNIPAGWDAQTYANFKAANPTLEPDAQDTANMLNAGNQNSPTAQKFGAQTDALQLHNDQVQQASQQYQQLLQQTHSVLEGITNGTVPLSPYEQSQIDATKTLMQQAHDAQMLANKNYEGAVTVNNENTGLSRYSPVMAAGNIFAAVSEGNKKISALDAQQSLAVSQMEQGFRDNDFNKVKSSFELLTQAKDEKMKAIDDMYNTAQQQIKNADEQRQESTMSSIGTTLMDPTMSIDEKRQIVAGAIAQGGLTYDQISKINGDLQKAETGKLEAGIVGEYQYYAQQEQARGRPPMSFFDFKNYKDPTSSTGGADKLRSDFLSREPVKQFGITQGAYDRMNAVAPTRDIADIQNLSEPEVSAIASQYARMLKPDIARAADSGDALADTSLSEIASGYERRWYNGKNVDPAKVRDALIAGDKLYKGAVSEVNGVKDEFKSRAESQGLTENDLPHVINAQSDSPVATLKEDDADAKVLKYASIDPNHAAEIKTKMDKLEAKFGRVLSSSEFLQAFPEYAQ